MSNQRFVRIAFKKYTTHTPKIAYPHSSNKGKLNITICELKNVYGEIHHDNQS